MGHNNNNNNNNNNDYDTEVIELGPGDVFYHPAGIYHRVECLEDSISINISMYGMTWADLFCANMKQLAWQHSILREPLLVPRTLSSSLSSCDSLEKKWREESNKKLQLFHKLVEKDLDL